MDNENEFQKQVSQENQGDSSWQSSGQFTSAGSNDGQLSQGNYNQEPEGNGMAIASLVLGILSLVLCCIPWLPYLFAVFSLVLGIMVLVQKKPGKGMAIAGIICSAICLILAMIGIIALVAFSTNVDFQNLIEELKNMQ